MLCFVLVSQFLKFKLSKNMRKRPKNITFQFFASFQAVFFNAKLIDK